MKHLVQHDLGQERAKKVAEAAIQSYEQKFAKYSPKANWVTPSRAAISFNVKGMTLNGFLDVQPTTIEMDLNVPFLLKPFKGTALGVIESEIREWIARAKNGEV